MKFPKLTHKEIIDNFNSAKPKSILQMKEEVKQMELERNKLIKQKTNIKQ